MCEEQRDRILELEQKLESVEDEVLYWKDQYENEVLKSAEKDIMIIDRYTRGLLIPVSNSVH